MDARRPEKQQQTQLLLSRHTASRPSSRRVAQVTIAFVFLLGTAYFLHPFSIESSYADSESNNYDTTVNIAPNLSISATDVSISDTPEASGSWLTGTSNVVVSTNNATGYKLYVSSSDSQVDLVNSDSSSAKISNLPAETTESTFRSDSSLMNHYGFTHDNNGSDPESGQITTGTYLPITDINNSRLIKATEEKQNISTTNVTFATKVDRSIPAGEYTNTITFTAIANPAPTPIENGMYFQDITTQMCADTPVYDSSNPSATTFTVKDKRDNQSYRVRRLYMTADKVDSPSTTACWMVDNLRLTKTTIEAAGGNATLDDSTSNVASDNTFALTVSDTSTWCTADSSACDDKPMLIDTPYGSLYNWYTATAGAGKRSSGVEAASSICPGKGKGTGITTKTWHLPTGNVSNEWYQLFAAYQSIYGWTTIYGTSNTGTMTNTWSTTVGPNFIYSGTRHSSETSGQSTTGIGSWWSSTADTTTGYAYAAHLRYSLRYVYGGTYSNYNHYGNAVRCVLPAF